MQDSVVRTSGFPTIAIGVIMGSSGRARYRAGVLMDIFRFGVRPIRPSRKLDDSGFEHVEKYRIFAGSNRMVFFEGKATGKRHRNGGFCTKSVP